MINRFAEVVIMSKSREIDKVFHYAIPDLMENIKEGTRVLVPFGLGNTTREGYVTGFSDTIQFDAKKIKKIIKPLDDFTVLDQRMLNLVRWMRKKYFATTADCIKCVALPAVKKRGNSREFIKTHELPPRLNDEQQNALGFIKDKFVSCDFKPTLIQGVTGSGKTEIYLNLISEMLVKNKQVIMLVPEISLTPQMIEIFAARFGGLISITHSRLSAGSRYESWNKARNGEISVMIGTRSAIFSPFKNLGLIIIDEEHDYSYKSDLSPKYSAKEIAEFFNREYNVHLVLGSATPSVESYHEALNGEVDLITLKKRVNKTMPAVYITDMRRELKEGNLSVFGSDLKEALVENFKKKEQCILFLNRRGHSTFVSCRRCGFVMKCDDCSVNLTYHKNSDALMCHYCGKNVKNPENCPVCGSKYIKYFGVGTQKVEEELKKFLPDCRILRMDFDTTSRINSHEKILTSFKNYEADILIGTQMIAKGLDIPNVTLVGVICADISLNMGDFRSGETTFQLLTQVAGRAGRAKIKGRVVVQTYNPEHYAVICAREQDYPEFYNYEISLRRQMVYPPFSKLFNIMFSGENEKKIIVLLFRLNEIMVYCNKNAQFEMIGPAPAIVSKIKKNYRWQIIIKAKDEEKLKNFALYCVNKLKEHEDLSGITVILTPDPK